MIREGGRLLSAPVMGVSADGAVAEARGERAELPAAFAEPHRADVIRKAHTILATHGFQPKGTHPTAGMDVSADSLDPPTGHGRARVARIRGSGAGGRGGQGGEVASTRGGRQAHPPTAAKRVRKRLNRKEGRLALRSAVAATADGALVKARGHAAGGAELPAVAADEAELISRTSALRAAIGRMGLAGDVERLAGRRARSGKPALRGRSKKEGKSILFVVSRRGTPLERAAGSVPGVDVRAASDVGVLDLAPGGVPGRLAVYTVSALRELGGRPGMAGGARGSA